MVKRASGAFEPAQMERDPSRAAAELAAKPANKGLKKRLYKQRTERIWRGGTKIAPGPNALLRREPLRRLRMGGDWPAPRVEAGVWEGGEDDGGQTRRANGRARKDIVGAAERGEKSKEWR